MKTSRRDNDTRRAMLFVQQAEERIEKQKALIAKLHAANRSTTQAEACLASLEKTLVSMRNYQSTLLSLKRPSYYDQVTLAAMQDTFEYVWLTVVEAGLANITRDQVAHRIFAAYDAPTPPVHWAVHRGTTIPWARRQSPNAHALSP